MEVICLETEAFYTLVEEVVSRMKELSDSSISIERKIDLNDHDSNPEYFKYTK